MTYIGLDIFCEKEQRSPDNLANNATFGLVETAQGETGQAVLPCCRQKD